MSRSTVNRLLTRLTAEMGDIKIRIKIFAFLIFVTLLSVGSFVNAEMSDDLVSGAENPFLLEMMDLHGSNRELAPYGRFITPGMQYRDYQDAMNQEWRKVHIPGAPQNLRIDLTKQYSFENLEWFMMDLSRHEGVELQVIGKSVQGRNIYALSLNFGEIEKDKPAVLVAGQVHANEYAGSVFILKQFSELVALARTDQYTRLLLENVRFEAIPIVNPDGREMNIRNNCSQKKSNANNVDLNRNFPAVNAAQVAKGVPLSLLLSATPGNAYYAGPNLGSEPETKAVMKWLETYVPIAVYFIDYHQQGRGIYSGRAWDTGDGKQNTKNFVQNFNGILNAGVSLNRYRHLPNPTNYEIGRAHV